MHHHFCHQYPSLKINTNHCCNPHLLLPHATEKPHTIGINHCHQWWVVELVCISGWLQQLMALVGGNGEKTSKSFFFSNELKSPKTCHFICVPYSGARWVVQTQIWINLYVFFIFFNISLIGLQSKTKSLFERDSLSGCLTP